MGEGDRQRKQWVRQIIDSHCKGNAAAFGRKIGKDSSYVSRMLATDTKQKRGISDEVVAAILEAFPIEAPAWYVRSRRPIQTTATSPAIDQIQQAFVALAQALARYAPDVAGEFDKNWLVLTERWPPDEKFPAILSLALRRKLQTQVLLLPKAAPRKAPK